MHHSMCFTVYITLGRGHVSHERDKCQALTVAETTGENCEPELFP